MNRNQSLTLAPGSRREWVVAALSANISGQVLTAVIQLVTVPIFLHFWSLEQYGAWLLLSAVPAYFALADVGFIGVATNKITMLASRGDLDKANIVFNSSILLYLAAFLLALIVATSIAIAIDFGPLGSREGKIALIFLVAAAMLTMSSGLFDSVYRANDEYARGAHLLNGARLLEWFGLVLGLVIGRTFLSSAIGQLVGRSVAVGALWTITRHRHANITWKTERASVGEIRALLGPALAFLAFPAANAISIQGMILVVGHMFGPIALAVFSTYRTLSRVLVQAVTIIGRSLWPEISRRYGAGDLAAVAAIYRKGTIWSFVVASVMCVAVYFAAEAILKIWTSGAIPYDPEYFNMFLLATVVTSLWQMGMVTLSATNKHLGLAKSYLLGAACSVVLVYLLGASIGVKSAVLSILLFELFLIVICAIHMRSFFSREAIP